jgi:hypothetical protein
VRNVRAAAADWENKHTRGTGHVADQDSIGGLGPFVVESIVIEAIVTVALAGWTVLVALPPASRPRPRRAAATVPAGEARRRM